MKELCAAFTAASIALSFTNAVNANVVFTLKHKGVACNVCHGTSTPQEPADQKVCIGCHGQYKGKVVPNADYNPDRNPRRPVVEVNPHDSHLGNVRCTLCHREHGASPKTACHQCHKNFVLQAK